MSLHQTHISACPDGCCLINYDPDLWNEYLEAATQIARPMYQILRPHDRGACYTCQALTEPFPDVPPSVMTVTQADYTDDGIFL